MDKHLELRSKIAGPVYSIVTPYTHNGESIDFIALKSYIQAIYLAGGRIFYVMGYNSRLGELSWDEIKVLNSFVVQTVKSLGQDTVVIVADPLFCPTSVSIDFCKHAESIGADLISLIFRQTYFSDDQIFKHYEACSKACNIGILIHEMFLLNGLSGGIMHWPLTLLDRIADLPNVIAIKEDAKNDEYAESLIATLKDRLAIVLSGGGKGRWLRFVEAGCQAWLNGVGVFEPRLSDLFWRAYQNGDSQTQQRIIQEVEKPFLNTAVPHYGWHLLIKSALELRGHMSRVERMPMLALDANKHAEVKAFMEKLPIDEILDSKR